MTFIIRVVECINAKYNITQIYGAKMSSTLKNIHNKWTTFGYLHDLHKKRYSLSGLVDWHDDII